jgi:hypothetical protein
MRLELASFGNTGLAEACPTELQHAIYWWMVLYFGSPHLYYKLLLKLFFQQRKMFFMDANHGRT